MSGGVASPSVVYLLPFDKLTSLIVSFLLERDSFLECRASFVFGQGLVFKAHASRSCSCAIHVIPSSAFLQVGPLVLTRKTLTAKSWGWMCCKNIPSHRLEMLKSK